MIKAAISIYFDIFLSMLVLVPYPEWFTSVFGVVGIVLDQIEIGLTFVDL
jgi:hypothetical protein